MRAVGVGNNVLKNKIFKIESQDEAQKTWLWRAYVRTYVCIYYVCMYIEAE